MKQLNFSLQNVVREVFILVMMTVTFITPSLPAMAQVVKTVDTADSSQCNTIISTAIGYQF